MWRKIGRWAVVPILTLLTFAPSWRESWAQSYQYFAFLPIVVKPCPVHSFIQDGSMEAGVPNPHWFVSSSQFSDVLDDSPDPAAHTGAWKAWMGGDNSVTEVISQTFAIPASVTQLALRYWVWIDTQDGAGGDTLAVQLRNAAGGVIATLDLLSIEAHLLALTLAPQIENFLDGRDTEALRKLLPKIGERNDTRVTITDHELFVVFSSDPRVGSGFEDNHVEFLAAQQGKEQHDIRLDEFTGQERIFTAAAIFGESGEAIAYIQLSAPTAPVWQSVYNAWAGMGLMLSATLAVAAALSAFLAGRIARPLVKLRDAANNLAFNAAPQLSLAAQGPAEVGDLIRAFNHMTERVQRAALRQREFVSGAAHELRSPLTALLLRLEMLAAHPPTAQELPRQMEALLAPLHRLRSAVDQLLLLASMEESNRLQPVPLDLSPLLYELAEEFAPRFAGRRFEVEAPPHLPLIRANADQARIIFANLLDNTAKHTPPQAAVFLKANVYPDRVEVQVADEGPGIPLEEQERVFERFYRSPQARSDTPGHGLGLAIVRELVHLNGGAIELESAPGRGACFRVTFPRREG